MATYRLAEKLPHIAYHSSVEYGEKNKTRLKTTYKYLPKRLLLKRESSVRTIRLQTQEDNLFTFYKGELSESKKNT